MTDEHALYRFYDADNGLLYIGITGDLARRFIEHARSQPWWHKVANIKVERYADRVELAAAEISAIEAERPKYNVSHAAAIVERTQIKDRHRKAESLWPDASRFETEYRPPVKMKRAKIRHSFSCPVCCWPVYQDRGPDGQPMPMIYCDYCGRTWTPDQWRNVCFPSVSGTR